MRIKTLPQIVRFFKEQDPHTAVNVSMLTELIARDQLPHDRHGNRIVADLDAVLPELNRMLELPPTLAVPHLRTIRTALAELKATQPDIGIGEDHLRRMVADGRLDCIRIGNRAYIALEVFEGAQVMRLTDTRSPDRSMRTAVESGVIEQIGALVASQVGEPRVVRMRRK